MSIIGASTRPGAPNGAVWFGLVDRLRGSQRSVHGIPQNAVVTGMYGEELRLCEFSGVRPNSSRTGWRSQRCNGYAAGLEVSRRATWFS
jgi:hypothetical protein